MMKKIILINIYLLLFLIGVNSIAQQVNVSSLVPKAGNATVYKYLTIKNGVNIGGLMHNVSSAAYGNGNDFSIYTYGSRDLNLRPGNGNINFYPNGNDQKFRFDRFGHFYWAQSRISSDQGGSIELGGTNALHGSTQTGTPYIDFHHKNQPASNSDYSVRLFNTGEDLLELRGGIFRIKTPGTSWATLSLDGREGGAGHEWRIRSKKSDGAGNLDIYNATSQTTALQITPSGDFVRQLKNTDRKLLTGWKNVPSGNTARYFMKYQDNIDPAGIEFFEFDARTKNMKLGGPNPNNKVITLGEFVITSVDGLGQLGSDVWPDYVFEEDYELPSLESIKEYVDEHKHLPLMQSAVEIGEDGLSVNQTILALTKQVEELLLHVVKQDEKISDLLKTKTN